MLILLTTRNFFHRMTAGADQFDQLDLAYITAHTFLEVYFLAPYGARWTALFADLAQGALWHALDA